jgi:hypothetical protein
MKLERGREKLKREMLTVLWHRKDHLHGYTSYFSYVGAYQVDMAYIIESGSFHAEPSSSITGVDQMKALSHHAFWISLLNRVVYN